jgi:RNA polymerase sigma-70 factor (ECF subfamily)
VEQVSAHKLFGVSITLDVPQKTLAAKEESHDVEATIRAAFEGIERQLDEYKAALRGEQWWKLHRKRNELRQFKIGGGDSGRQDREWFFALVNPHLEKLNEVVRHVLTLMEARGDLPFETVDPEDIVGATLIRAYDEFSKDRAQGEIRSRLIRFTLKEVEAEVRRVKKEREGDVAVEQEVPAVLLEEGAATLGEEILDLYRPDERLEVEDIFPDLQVPPPEQEMEQEELRKCVRKTLRDMPREAQQALVVRYEIGLHGSELANALGKPTVEAKRLLDAARAKLRQALLAAGCVPVGPENEPSLAGGELVPKS